MKHDYNHIMPNAIIGGFPAFFGLRCVLGYFRGLSHGFGLWDRPRILVRLVFRNLGYI
jgi:hypothetical protein